jgi:amino-acid N-acetyltransferase
MKTVVNNINSNHMIQYNLAMEADLEAIRRLLETSHLPYSNIQQSPVTFMVTRDEKRIVGCIGLEKFGNTGLLRSFAVDPGFQNKGIGKALYRHLVDHADSNQIRSLHLLTNTAKDYFSRIGFRLAQRSGAPEGIAGSAEFAALCPVSSSYMILDPISSYVS